MHYTLHLTNRCNMACDYCQAARREANTMSPETAKKAIDLAARACEKSIGIIFYGGEPLLVKELIAGTVEYCRSIGKKNGFFFHYKIVTNGLLLDESFMKYAQDNGILLTMSHDGIKDAHDSHRRTCGGEGTFDVLSDKIGLLLSYQPYAPVMMTVCPDTAVNYAESVSYLYGMGFRYIISSLEYAGSWDEQALKTLQQQYTKLSDIYLERALSGDKFYLSPFEVRPSLHTDRKNYCREECGLGKKQISVGPDGVLYPCIRFVGDAAYAIGNVMDGVGETARDRLYCENEMEKAHQELLLPIADSLAERLCDKRNEIFVQKRLNDTSLPASSDEDRQIRDFKVYRNK